MRNTLQTTVVKEELNKLGHATNHELWEAAQKRLPGISLTTIHRITTRLKDKCIIGTVPNWQGEALFDFNPLPHAHFMCRECVKLVDIEISKDIVKSISRQLNDAEISSNLLITGSCNPCLKA